MNALSTLRPLVLAIALASGSLAAADAQPQRVYFGDTHLHSAYSTDAGLAVRVFAGWDFGAEDLARPDFVHQGYSRGVPMGGDLRAAPQGKAASFLIQALRDPNGANLDRIQMVKGWLDDAGQAHEQVYDVAWSGERRPDAKTGKLPPSATPWT